MPLVSYSLKIRVRQMLGCLTSNYAPALDIGDQQLWMRYPKFCIIQFDRLRLYVLKLAVGTLRNFKNSRSKKVQNSLVSTQYSAQEDSTSR